MTHLNDSYNETLMTHPNETLKWTESCEIHDMLINSYEKDPEKQIQSVDEIKLEDFEYLP